MNVNNLTSCISHEEAVIQHFIEDPELAQIMLQDAINDGDISEIRKIQRRINEAKSRSAHDYWNNIIGHARETAKNGHNIGHVVHVVSLVSQALDILKSAFPLTHKRQ